MNERDPIMISIALAGLIVAVLAWQLPKSTYASFSVHNGQVAKEVVKSYSVPRPPISYGNPHRPQKVHRVIATLELSSNIDPQQKFIPKDVEQPTRSLFRYADIYGDPKGSIRVEETPETGGVLLKVSGPYPASAAGPTFQFEFAVLKRTDEGWRTADELTVISPKVVNPGNMFSYERFVPTEIIADRANTRIVLCLRNESTCLLTSDLNR